MELLIGQIKGRSALLARLMAFVPRNMLVGVAHGLIISKLRFGLPIYGAPRITTSDYQNVMQKKLQTEVNNVMRLLAGKSKLDMTPIIELMRLTTLPSVNRLVVEQSAIEFWKSVKYELPFCAERKILRDETASTRSGKRLAVVPVPKRLRHNMYDSVQLRWARVWNALPEATRTETDELAFKGLARAFAEDAPLC